MRGHRGEIRKKSQDGVSTTILTWINLSLKSGLWVPPVGVAALPTTFATFPSISSSGGVIHDGIIGILVEVLRGCQRRVGAAP